MSKGRGFGLDLSESEWDQANTVIPAALKPNPFF
jgi:hypothetical protein